MRQFVFLFVIHTMCFLDSCSSHHMTWQLLSPLMLGQLWAAASSATPTPSASTTRGAGRSSGTSVCSFWCCTSLLLPWEARPARVGCPTGHPPLCPGSTVFCRTDFSIAHQISGGILQQCFLSGSWALCPHLLLVPLLIAQRASRETADNCHRISQLQQEQTVSNHRLSVLPGH